MKKTAILILTLFFLLNAGNAAAAEKKPMTAEDLWQVQRFGNLELSPDGSTLVFPLTGFDLDKNEGSTNLYLLDVKSGKMSRLTNHPGSDSAPAWSPDGRKIAFLSRRGEDKRNQLYLIPVDGGEAARVTEMPLGIMVPRWLPDGRSIAYFSPVIPELAHDPVALDAELKKRNQTKVTARVTENRFYRYWDTWQTEEYVPHLYAVETASGKRRHLTPGWSGVKTYTGAPEYDIAPDGKSIVISANATPAPYREPLNFDLFLLKTDGSGEMTNLTADNPADDSGPFFSPNGRFVYFLRRSDPGKLAENARLARIDLKEGSMKVLTEKIDLSCNSPHFSPDGRHVYFLAEDRARVSIFRVNSEGGDFREIKRDGTNSSLQVGRDRLYVLNQNLSRPPEIAALDLRRGNFSFLTALNSELLSGMAMGQVREHYFKGADDREVQMFVILPPGFDPAKKWPLLHLLHGGPHGTFGDDFHFRWNAQLFAAPGYVTAMVNFHGSTSFGQDFAESIVGAHGDKPLADILRATDFLLAEYPSLDEKRIAAAGGSYGGFLASWLATQTDRFATLISHAGVYNFMGQFASDLTHFRELAYGGSPWRDTEKLERYNPARYAAAIKTPMLILHGERDYRVLVTQGLELFGVLQGKGVPSRLVYFPDENHFIGKPQNSVFWYKEIHAWLDQHLGAGGR